jgi:amino acid permease
MCNLFIAAAGAGVLSYPFAVLHEGLVASLLSSFLFASLNAYTDLILAYTANKVAHTLHVGTYEEVAYQSIGSPGLDPRYPRLSVVLSTTWLSSSLPLASVLLGCLGSCIGFFIIVGDMGADVLLHWWGAGLSSDGARALATFGFAAAIMPVCMAASFRHLTVASAIAAISVIVVGGLVVCRGASILQEAGPPAGYVAPASSMGPLGLIIGLPINIFSLGNHIQAVPIFLEMPKESKKYFHVPVLTSVILCLVLYLCTGIFGYFAFGSTVNADVLSNFALADNFANVAKALMVFHIALALPVIVLPCKKAFFMLYHMCKQNRRGCMRPTVSPAEDRDVNTHNEDSTSLLMTHTQQATTPFDAVLEKAVAAEHIGNRRILGMNCGVWPFTQTFFVVMGTAAVAVAIPQLSLVFGLLGATVAVSQIYVFPACMLIRHAMAIEAAQHMDTRPQASDKPVDTHFSRLQADDMPQYIPATPFWLFTHACVLLIISAFVMLVGTGTTIYQSFLT